MMFYRCNSCGARSLDHDSIAYTMRGAPVSERDIWHDNYCPGVAFDHWIMKVG